MDQKSYLKELMDVAELLMEKSKEIKKLTLESLQEAADACGAELNDIMEDNEDVIKPHKQSGFIKKEPKKED